MFVKLMGSKKNICESQSQSQLVLDSVKGELVKGPAARVVQKADTTEAKALAALKNHSEAEKRRRQRINAHLTTLRSLLPSSSTRKMDKATLLAEVVTHMKELEKKASETCQGLLLPMDRDEVTVEPLPCEEIHKNASFKVSLCFRYRHDILLHIRKAITALQLRVVSVEMSTFEEWLKIAFIFFTDRDSVEEFSKEMKMISIHRAFSSVLEKNSSVDDDYSAATSVSRKRKRLSVFESSSSSS